MGEWLRKTVLKLEDADAAAVPSRCAQREQQSAHNNGVALGRHRPDARCLPPFPSSRTRYSPPPNFARR